MSEDDVIIAIEAILNLQIGERLKESLLSRCIWKWTERYGKYSPGFESEAAKSADKKQKRHEHVYPRKELIKRMIGSPPAFREIMKDAIACVVTVEEHKKLEDACRKNSYLQGWERYKAAGIRVLDESGSVFLE